MSQLSSYQPSKPFLLFGHGSKPLSKYTRVHRLWDTRDEGLFLKILDNPDRLQATEVIQKKEGSLAYLAVLFPDGKKNEKGGGYSYTLAKGRHKRAILFER